MNVVTIKTILRSNLDNYCSVTECGKCGILIFATVYDIPCAICPAHMQVALRLSDTKFKYLMNSPIPLTTEESAILGLEENG